MDQDRRRDALSRQTVLKVRRSAAIGMDDDRTGSFAKTYKPSAEGIALKRCCDRSLGDGCRLT
jgi:hypothetical protein